MPPSLLYLASWITVSGGIYLLFNRTGESVKEETKIKVSAWLKSISVPYPNPNSTLFFVDLFEIVFTKKHFYWKCITRSVIASILAYIIVMLIYQVNDPEYGLDTVYSFFSFVLWMFIFLNLVPDYFSLLETRIILKKLKTVRSVPMYFFLLILDLMLTALIYYLNLIFFGSIQDLFTDGFSFNIWKNSISGTTDLYLGLWDYTDIFSVWLYSTFLTSIWLWLFLISTFFIKILTKSLKGLEFFQKHLDIDNKPFNAIGYFLMINVTIVYIIIGIFKLIF
ncbi:MAG: hypothetical protein K9G76_00995 [Bacteroidales bacterium]|nr:hypothetical protein [Bacteroidales bacterium]MCF8402691.1 hypothetical protein [Bacteroidales bacterium]